MSVSEIIAKATVWLCTALSAMLSLSCEKAGEARLTYITIEVPGVRETRSADPDEDRISDINLFIFSEDGMLEESCYLPSRTVEKNNGRISIRMPLVRGIESTIACCANFGYQLEGIRTLEELSSYRYYMAYPDEYTRGIPMSCIVTETWGPDDDSIVLSLERMMARISVAMDRSELDSGVRIAVKSVRIGNCPRSASVAGPSTVRGNSDVFTRGFVKSYAEADAMNREIAPGQSGEVSVYMLENRMGDLLDDTTDDYGKIPGGGLASSCSFIEIECEYESATVSTRPGEYIRYRFYPGENNWNFDIARNCHYHFAVQPYGNGLGDSSWRVDTSGLE